MTIRKGEAWGTIGPAPAGVVEVADDAALGELVTAARREGRPIPTVHLRGGDLWRAVGGGGPARGGDVALLPLDVVRVEADDGRVGWYATHLVARGAGPLGWVRGRLLAAMNGQYLGDRDLAPRAHPNDGLVDVVEVAPAMSPRDRWRGWRRAVHASHLPHPHVAVRRAASATLELERPLVVWLDGRRWGRARRLDLVVEPDAFTGCV